MVLYNTCVTPCCQVVCITYVAPCCHRLPSICKPAQMIYSTMSQAAIHIQACTRTEFGVLKTPRKSKPPKPHHLSLTTEASTDYPHHADIQEASPPSIAPSLSQSELPSLSLSPWLLQSSSQSQSPSPPPSLSPPQAHPLKLTPSSSPP